MTQDMQEVAVIGAGVIGLSTAIKLQQDGYKVVILARDMPSDAKSLSYTSPWAGAHHVSVATGSTMEMHEFDKETFGIMSDMIKQDPNVPMMFAKQTEYREDPRPDSDTDQVSLLGRIYPDFRRLNKDELPEGIQHGATFTCILIDTPHYLPFLQQMFEERGGRMIRASLQDVSEIATYAPQVDAVVNCTGLGARELGGVADKAVFPTRGQLVIVRAPWVTEGRTRLGNGVYTYTIPRKSGRVVLGGSADANDWDGVLRPELTERIKRLCVQLHPELLPEDKRAAGRTQDLDVVELACGLRPTRTGGIRLEIDRLSLPIRSVPLVHNYGHGGYGYQTSWATARRAAELVGSALHKHQSKLY